MEGKKQIIKIVLDIFCLVVVGLVWAILVFVPEPFHRGFFCNDESIAYPYKDSTISTLVLAVVGAGVPIITILIIEGIHVWNNRKRGMGDPPIYIGSKAIPCYVFRCYRLIGCFTFGLCVTKIITGIGKVCIGRLRPHFLDVCKPDYSKFDCQDTYGNYLYILDDFCTYGGESGTKKIKEMRLSFPSGHASMAMYCMLFISVYCHARFNWKGSKLLCPLLQSVFIMMAFYTCLSRVSDNKHHWSDVLSGAVLGIFMACLTVSRTQFVPRVTHKHVFASRGGSRDARRSDRRKHDIEIGSDEATDSSLMNLE